jgi:hypothetical protein
MNTQDTVGGSDLSRANKRIEAAVNRGLVVAMLDGVAAAAALMKEEGVPIDVSARVLINPEQRRASDWK